MVSFEIISSNDTDSIGTYEFLLDRITIGDTRNSLLTIYDKYFNGSSLTLKILNNKLFIIYDTREFTVNGVGFFGTKVLSPGDKINIGETIIKICKFKQDFDLSKNLSEEVTNIKKDLSTTDPSRIDLILQIEDEIISHEENEF